MDTGANDISHDFLRTQIHRCHSILTSVIDVLCMPYAWFKLVLTNVYDWYTEMDDANTYRWWSYGALMPGCSHILLFDLGLKFFHPSWNLNPIWGPIIFLCSFVIVFFSGLAGSLFFMNFAIEHGPIQSRMIYTLGCLPKSVAEIGVLCIAVAFHYAFNDAFFSFAWASFVIHLQYYWQLRYASRDFVFFDLLLGVLMQILFVSRKDKDLYDFSFMVICFLCFLVIYMKNWYTPSCTTILGKREYLSEESITGILPQKESLTGNVKEEKLSDNGIP